LETGKMTETSHQGSALPDAKIGGTAHSIDRVTGGLALRKGGARGPQKGTNKNSIPRDSRIQGNRTLKEGRPTKNL